MPDIKFDFIHKIYDFIIDIYFTDPECVPYDYRHLSVQYGLDTNVLISIHYIKCYWHWVTCLCHYTTL